MRFYKEPLSNHFKRLVFFAFLITNVFAQQLKGIIYDEKNEPLPFVNISIDGTGIGTSSNLSGAYNLPLKNGTYTLTFRYVGYSTIKKEVLINGTDVVLDVILDQQQVEIKPYYVTGGEDPAYGIIRSAQKKRKFYLEQVKSYQYDSYIKGSAYLRNAPEKVLGREVFLDGLDSTRSGMIYLSESVSKVYLKGREEKEIMISSKVAGKSQGFSWNSALEFQLNFYENLVPTPVTDRDIISPIASDAMTYYKYKLLGEYIDNGRTIYRIDIKPKVTGSPLVNGIVEIQDSTWRIHSIDIFVTKNNGMDLLDTLNMKVIFVPITPNIWLKGTQQFDFKFTFNLFKIKGDGHFLGSFNNYLIDPTYEKNFFNNEVVKINDESNQKTNAYWDSIRPVPLTNAENRDYEFKDSLEDVRETKSYMDSLDRKKNKFKATDLITGYTWRNSYRKIQVFVSSPLMGFHFNTVEGIVITEQFGFQKNYKETKGQTNVNAFIRYGFDDGRLFGKLSLRHRFNSTNRWYIGIEGGHYISQFNGEVMPELHNSLYTVFLEINHWRIFEKTYGKISTGGEVFNGFRLNAYFEAAYRRDYKNANPLTKFYIDNKNRGFGENNDFDNAIAVLPSGPGWLITSQLQISYTPGQNYMMRPKFKLNYPSKWPTISISGKVSFVNITGLPDWNYFLLGEASIEQDIDMGIIGNSEYYISGGYFFKQPGLFFGFHHFNTTQTVFAPRDELRSFWTLPYYQASTNDYFVQAHYQHHFKGWLLGKIPGIKKLKIYEVVGFHFLYNPVIKDYYEFTIGFENIFRILRVDFVGGFILGEQPMFGGRIKINI
jgi:hypothetical protein